MRRSISLALCVSLLGLSACVSPTESAPIVGMFPSEDATNSSLDAGQSDAAALDAGQSDAAALDAGQSDAAARTCDTVGCQCATASDCASGFCAPSGTCAAPCEGDRSAGDPCNGKDDDCDGVTDEDTCDDADPCTESDSCKAGKCAGVAKVCDDQNPCTTDACDATGCVNKATTAPCDDGDLCTTEDTCDAGACTGATKLCEDGNPCTTGTCAKGDCSQKASPGPCDDGDSCTSGDSCGAGKCGGKLKTCDDNNPCTADSCAAGKCKHPPVSATCNDGDICTKSDTCKSGKCVGQPKACEDGKLCTLQDCDPKKGCLFSPVTMPTDGVPQVPYCGTVSKWSSKAKSWEAEVVKLVNSARAKSRVCGNKKFGAVGPVVMNAGLRCAARTHSVDMVNQKYFSHINKQGKNHAWRIKLTCYPSGFVGENIAAGQTSPSAVVKAWLASPGHCANIMQPGYKGTGVGYVAGGKYKHMWTQTFGAAP